MKKTNPMMKKLVKELLEKEEKIWKDIAKRLSKPRKIEVNIARINRFTNEGENIIVPGKVLGYGNLDKKVIVTAFDFSKGAEKKIRDSNGECMSIEELLKKNPKGNKTRIFG